MKKGQNTARVLLASALSVLLSIAMLTATTFAWFVDGVNNTNNEIHTGNMDVRFFGARYQVDESGQVKWGTINNLSRDALISVNDMEPGDYGAAVIAVSNLYNDISADVEVQLRMHLCRMFSGIPSHHLRVLRRCQNVPGSMTNSSFQIPMHALHRTILKCTICNNLQRRNHL